MNDYEHWLKTENCSVREWYTVFCRYRRHISALVTESPFSIVGIKYTGFNYYHDSILTEPSVMWCHRNLGRDDYQIVFVLDIGADGINYPVDENNNSNSRLMYVRAIMFQNESDAAWFKLSCIENTCDAYKWPNDQ